MRPASQLCSPGDAGNIPPLEMRAHLSYILRKSLCVNCPERETCSLSEGRIFWRLTRERPKNIKWIDMGRCRVPKQTARWGERLWLSGWHATDVRGHGESGRGSRKSHLLGTHTIQRNWGLYIHWNMHRKIYWNVFLKGYLWVVRLKVFSFFLYSFLYFPDFRQWISISIHTHFSKFWCLQWHYIIC